MYRDNSSNNEREERLTCQDCRSSNSNSDSDSDSGSDSPGRREKSCFHPEEVGFCYPFLEVRDGAGDGEIVNWENITYYRTVRLYIDAVKKVSQTEDSRVVRRNLNKYFRGAVQAWYTEQLTRDEKLDMKSGRRLVKWENALLRKFRKTQCAVRDGRYYWQSGLDRRQQSSHYGSRQQPRQSSGHVPYRSSSYHQQDKQPYLERK